ncbi:unnamed protein product, partial [marine sediment metagenome]
MGKTVTIHQPAYLPWLGYFDKIVAADVFVFLDSVQFGKNSFTNRNKVKTANGPVWLTVPLRTKGHTKRILRDIEISPDPRWKKKHIETIRQSYTQTPYFDQYFGAVERFILEADKSFCDFVYEMTLYFLATLGIQTKVIRSSRLRVTGKKSRLIENLCVHLDADLYISGPFGRTYLELPRFAT